jgi:hypothetical protein
MTASGTTFISELGHRPVDVVVGQAAGVEIPRRAGTLVLKFPLFHFVESAADGVAIFFRHRPDGCHHFGDRGHANPPVSDTTA